MVSGKFVPHIPERVRRALRCPLMHLTLTGFPSTTAWFLSGNNIHMFGGGTLDANGQVWWDALASRDVRS